MLIVSLRSEPDMKRKLQTPFNTRQYMISEDFELYYYSDSALKDVPLHSHNYYEFYFFLEGDVSYQVDEKVFSPRFGDVMLIPPGVMHKPIIHSTAVPYRRFIFWISEEYYQYLKSLSQDYAYLINYVQNRREYLFHNDQITFNAIQAKLILLLEEMQGNRFGQATQVALYIQDLLLHLNRLVYQHTHPRKRREQEALYQNICLYIEEHLEEDLSLDRLSQVFFVSKYHIAHNFKENLGLSIHQYITRKRLTQCRESILSGMSITNAYQRFGFGDYSSFYRAFKKEYGISPKDYQDMNMLLLTETGTDQK